MLPNELRRSNSYVSFVARSPHSGGSSLLDIWRCCAGFSDAGGSGLAARAEAGVGEAPRHEVAGCWAVSAQRALWR